MAGSNPATVQQGRRQAQIAAVCAGIALGMLGLAYASVPLYRLFCQVTGFGGTTQRAVRPSTEILDRSITVRFDANVGNGLPWRFEPEQTSQTLQIGENGLAFYRVTNLSDRPIVGTASFNVTPEQAGIYFNKIECFCFTEQRLKPGESLTMPVSYFVDPAIVKDADTSRMGTLTLSYTFFEVAKPAAPAKAVEAQRVKSGS